MFLNHNGCDRCIYKCKEPIILSVLGNTYRGHKDCMHLLRNEIIKKSKKLK